MRSHRSLSLMLAIATCAAPLTPLAAQSVKQVTVTLTSPTIALGSRTTAIARVRLANGTYATNKPIAWGTSKPGIALVSEKGVVSTIAIGSASIVATVSGVTGQAIVSVTQATTPPTPAVVASVSVVLQVSSVTVGATSQAAAIPRDSSGDILTNRTVSWTSIAPSVASVSSTGLATGAALGTTTIRATVEGKTGDAPITVTAPPPVDTAAPTLPTLLTTTVASTPSAGRALTVISGGNLQAALDSSRFGDRITLTCGATFPGNFTLTTKPAGTGWVTVQSSCTLPSEGTRTDTTRSFATISSPNVLPAISTVGATQRWRFIGIEVTTSAGTNQGLVALGCANQCETSTAQQPSDIIFDRSYIHAPASTDVRRCLGFNGARLSVIDSYVSDCHSAFDAQAIAGWNGPGPFKIVNNYLEGAAENIAFGGADPAIPSLIPSDIEIRRNHIAKRMSWKGGQWLIKNLVELKIGRRVLVEGNVIENSWPQAQNGFAFVLWSVNQQTTCTWCVTEHVTIQNNLIRNVAAGWSMVATGANGLTQYRAVPMNHVAIRNNVVIGLDNVAVGGYGRIFEMSDTIQSLSIEHNTAFSPSNSSFIWAGALPLPNHIVKNNLVGGGQYQIFTTFGQGQIAWDHAGGPGSLFDHNAVAVFSGGNMIAGNWGLDAFADVGLVGGASAATSVTATLDDLALAGNSQLKGQATDGTDVGADIAAIKAAIANVVRP